MIWTGVQFLWRQNLPKSGVEAGMLQTSLLAVSVPSWKHRILFAAIPLLLSKAEGRGLFKGNYFCGMGAISSGLKLPTAT